MFSSVLFVFIYLLYMYFISTEMINKILYYTSDERQLAVSGKALDHTAIGQALSDERQLAVSGNALDHMAVRAGPQ